MSSEKQLYDFYEKMLVEFSSKIHYERMLRAKKEFFILTGVSHEDDDDYENRMNSFTDWYLFDYVTHDRPISSGMTYIENKDVSDEIRKAFLNINHSIFEFNGETITKKKKLTDLLHKKTYLIPREAGMPGLVKDDLFIGRTVSIGEGALLLSGVSLLPKNSKSIVKKECQIIGAKKNTLLEKSFLYRTEYFKTKYRRYSHVGVDRIFDYQYR